MDALPPPSSGLPLELGFRRRLQRCQEIIEGDTKGRDDLQEWASSPVFHANVDLLQEEMADLSGLIDSRLDSDVVNQYQQIVTSLARRLQPIALPSFVKADYRREQSTTFSNSATQPSKQIPASAPELRQRAQAGIRGPLQQETKDKLQRQSHLQDDLTDEMVTLAASLKRNAQAMKAAVERRGGQLDETEFAIDESLIRAKKSSKQASAMKVRGSISICTFLLLMALTCMILVGTYLFIKTTSFLGYKRQPR